MKTSFDTHQAPPSLPLPSPPAKTNQFIQERYRSQDQGVSISLTTREGDQITIHQSASREQMKAKYMTADGMSKIESSLVSANMSFAVEGDLNDQELADLSKLLDDLSGIANNFFKGNMNQALTAALNIGDMGSINKLEATFTRTSMLSTYMEGPHPIPSFADRQNDPLLQAFPDIPEKATGPSMIAAMAAQWGQFLDSLPLQTAAPLRHNKSPTPTTALTGKEMFDRAKETMTTHPRLTPLIPSVANLAIDQVLRRFGQDRHSNPRAAQEISSAFTNEVNRWFL